MVDLLVAKGWTDGQHLEQWLVLAQQVQKGAVGGKCTVADRDDEYVGIGQPVEDRLGVQAERHGIQALDPPTSSPQYSGDRRQEVWRVDKTSQAIVRHAHSSRSLAVGGRAR